MNKIDRRLTEVINSLINELNQKKALLLFTSKNLQVVLLEEKEIENHLYFLGLIRDRLELLDQHVSLFHLFDYYQRLNEVMDFANFSSYEKGYIFNKFLISNFFILNMKPYSYIKLNEYPKELIDLGIKDQLSFELAFKKFLKKKNTDKKTITDAIIESIMIQEENNRLFLVNQYKKIKVFTEKENKNSEDYTLISNVLKKLGVSDTLVQCYITYYEKESTKKIKKTSSEITFSKKEVTHPQVAPESLLSKKQLKLELAKLYDDKNRNSFDYVHYIKVLKLLKYLNYADEIKERLLNGMFQVAIKNYSFYQYIFNKVEFSGKQSKEIAELKKIFPSMFICSPEDYELYKTYILETLDDFSFMAIENFDYEMHLMKKI